MLEHHLIPTELRNIGSRYLRRVFIYIIIRRRRYMVNIVRVRRRNMYVYLCNTRHPPPEQIRKLGVGRADELVFY